MENKKSVLVIPADTIRELIPQNFFEEIYHLPEYMAAVAPSECWFARIELPEVGIAYFPFTGQKWLWRWRIYQASFCQRFSPISTQGTVQTQHWETWKNWMENNCWFGTWSFYPQPALEGAKKLKNQYFSFDFPAFQLLNKWKSNRRQALKKSENCSLKPLSSGDFFSELKIILKKNPDSKWNPSFKEIQILKRISNLEIPDFESLPFGIFHQQECVALVLLTRYRNRLYYLFSLSSPLGFSLESMTYFFSQMIQKYSESPLIFDFEGSNIPGVQSFFRSLGGEDEYYGNFTI